MKWLILIYLLLELLMQTATALTNAPLLAHVIMLLLPLVTAALFYCAWKWADEE